MCSYNCVPVSSLSLSQSPCLGSSSSSLNIESALECFDFLDNVTEERGRDSPDSLASWNSKNGIYGFVSSRQHYHNPSVSLFLSLFPLTPSSMSPKLYTVFYNIISCRLIMCL